MVRPAAAVTPVVWPTPLDAYGASSPPYWNPKYATGNNYSIVSAAGELFVVVNLRWWFFCSNKLNRIVSEIVELPTSGRTWAIIYQLSILLQRVHSEGRESHGRSSTPRPRWTGDRWLPLFRGRATHDDGAEWHDDGCGGGGRHTGRRRRQHVRLSHVVWPAHWRSSTTT